MRVDNAAWYQVRAYEPGDALPLTKMWRESKERAQGFVEQHTLAHQQAFLESHLVASCQLQVAFDVESMAIVGFLAMTPATLEQLYIHVDYQGRGLGTHLLQRAKDQAPAGLDLYTLEPNTKAHAFYEKHGFRLIARGFATHEQVPDRLYRWDMTGVVS